MGNATSADILVGKTARVGGALLTGTMANNRQVNGSINGFSTTSITVPEGYTSGGAISLTDDIESALREI